MLGGMLRATQYWFIVSAPAGAITD